MDARQQAAWLLLQRMEDFQKHMDDMVLEMRDLRAAMDRQVTDGRYYGP